jgi:hypothetical protein
MAPVELSHYRVVEVCAGAGGQSLGLELAGAAQEPVPPVLAGVRPALLAR